MTRAVRLALLLSLAASGAQAACLPYDGRHVLEGRLIRHTYPGPPNFESIADGDRKETYWLLKLRRPICVAASPHNADGLKGGAKDVTAVQLVVAPRDYKRHRRLIGQEVIATGTFFSAITAHHHTPILLWQPRLRPAG